MSESEKKDSSFIRERIVPKKNLKKVILTVVSVIALALVFGVVAGVAFSISRNLFGREVVPTEAPIIIIPRPSDQEDPDDILVPESSASATEKATEKPTEKATQRPTEKPTEKATERPTEKPTEKPTERPTEKPTEKATERPTERPTEKPTERPTERPTEKPTEQPTEAPTEPPTEAPSSSEPEPSTETETPAETEPEPSTEPETPAETEAPTVAPTEPAPVTLQSLYQALSPSIIQVVLELPAGSDWFQEPLTARRDTFAVPIGESEEALFLLADASFYEDGALFHVYLGNEILIMEPYCVDELSHLAVLRISKDLLKVELSPLKIGYSTSLRAGSRVFLFGTLYGRFSAMDEGRITYVAAEESILDGYRQALYTNMYHTPDGAGILINEDGELVGWMSNASSGSGSMAIAYGITSLADTIDNLNQNKKAPYFGVICRRFTAEETSGTDRVPGLYVQEVKIGSPAFAAGIQAGDRIVSIDQRTMTSNRTLQTRLNFYSPGTTVTVVIGRLINGAEEQMTLTLTLGER